MPPPKTCFVVMGFGKKTDFETGRTIDLDKTCRNIIKPAGEPRPRKGLLTNSPPNQLR